MKVVNRFISVIFIALLLSCNNSDVIKVNCCGYSTGVRVSDEWLCVNIDDEREFKFLKHKADSNLFCIAVADTIWNIMWFGIDDKQADSIVSEVNSLLNVISECRFRKRIGDFRNCYQYEWYDTINGDYIELDKCRLGSGNQFGSWSLTIINDSLLNDLNSRHDPFYDLPIPVGD